MNPSKIKTLRARQVDLQANALAYDNLRIIDALASPADVLFLIDALEKMTAARDELAQALITCVDEGGSGILSQNARACEPYEEIYYRLRAVEKESK